ncbi:hypothetical protein BB31_16195 [Amycolatopsis lurida NRRL 2430]|uniref:HTH araC/xylS-type domain-containing protein n=1 Tax=Amycolatopsis lurida NRRL 2430 TaxID=1460371 RepID=A0A2P2FUH2_AMYLU|nr:hypothetical protein BB31_16195 [Amycolatopsis lurida NRRL 2430]
MPLLLLERSRRRSTKAFNAFRMSWRRTSSSARTTPSSMASAAPPAIRGEGACAASPMRTLGPSDHGVQVHVGDHAHAAPAGAAPVGLIGDIAHRWGITHLGRFAGEYRTRFGELPSATRH